MAAPPTDTLNSGNVNGKNWIPAEADVSIRPGWFYHAKEDSKVKSPETLFNLYLRSVGNGGNLLLNVPPDRTGRIHPADSASLVGFRKLRDAAFAKDLLQNAHISSPSSKKNITTLTDRNIQTYWASAQKENSTLLVTLPKKTTVNTLVLEEMISYGQRVSAFTIESFDGEAFKTVFTGTTIGRKKIARFPEQETTQLRIVIQQAKAAPVLRSISAYQIPN